ncbi:protein lethal(2)essential for life-like [Contarinia nasturtii]|uniref:protein lethal(2)essential for life-like n=1 Tax=Contarinia nasturtii TaxID=265458 RepID=UPI0012D4577F|nr:protein lethal(2)essential for life-like [Contarinia nasturtii]
MAMQLKTIATKLFNPTLNVVRHRSRGSILPTFWEDPFTQHRSLIRDFWNSDPFDSIFPSRSTGYRLPYWEGDRYLNTPKDGFEVNLNVQNFKPEEVSVKVAENNIIIEAKHEERNEDESFVSRHFSRRYRLPDNCNIKEVVSTLSADGILTVRAPPKEIDTKSARTIHIQHTGTSHVETEPKKTDENKDEQKK